MTPVAEAPADTSSDGAMDFKTNSDRVESLLRGMLAFVLLVAVAWAYAQGSPVTA